MAEITEMKKMLIDRIEQINDPDLIERINAMLTSDRSEYSEQLREEIKIAQNQVREGKVTSWKKVEQQLDER